MGHVNMKKCKTLLIIFLLISIGFLSILTNSAYALKIKENKILGQNPHAIIETNLGTINIELYQNLVPNTVENFIDLTKINFYNGLVFHRILNDFVIQGGGHYPNGTRKDSPYGPIDLEIHSKARHYDGAVGMARTSNPNSAKSQFYICDGAQHSLDDNYAVFGRVTLQTRSVVRTIAAVETMTKYGMKDWPVDDIIINSVTINAKSFSKNVLESTETEKNNVNFPKEKKLIINQYQEFLTSSSLIRLIIKFYQN